MAFKSRIPQIAAQLPARVNAVGRLAAERVEAGAKERVPVGAPTVHLRDEIHVEDLPGTGDFAVIAGGDKAFYGHIVEHGSVHAAAHPFMVPAAEEVRAQINEIAKVALRDLA